MKSTLKLLMLASRRRSSLSSVTSSFTPRMISPVSSSMTFWALTLPTTSSRSIGSLSRSASLSLRIAWRVNLRFLRTIGFALDLDVARGALARQEVELDRLRVLLAVDEDGLGAVVEREQLFGAVAERLEQHRRVHLAAAVDAHVDQVLRVELEVEPRAAVRNDARLVEELAGRVGLALVVVEEDARAAVQLAHDDALGAVDDERTVLGHQRDLAEVDLLLLDVAHDALAAFGGTS